MTEQPLKMLHDPRSVSDDEMATLHMAIIEIEEFAAVLRYVFNTMDDDPGRSKMSPETFGRGVEILRVSEENFHALHDKFSEAVEPVLKSRVWLEPLGEENFRKNLAEAAKKSDSEDSTQ